MGRKWGHIWFQSCMNAYSASWFLCILSLDVFYHLFEPLICFINWNLMISLFVLLFVLSIGIDDFLICSFHCTCNFFFLNELLQSISSNKLVMVCTGGQIFGVQALSEELPGQFLTYIRGRDIKPHCLHVAPTFAWEHFLGPQDVQICWFCSQQLKVLKGLNH